MKIPHLNLAGILLLAAFQDLLLLLALVATAGNTPPVPTHAWLIASGVSHHFVSAAGRRDLNQAQHTLGLEVTHGHWTAQVSHMTDSFGCSSNELAVARRWKLFGGQEVSGGVMLGAMAAHRCTSFPTSAQTEMVALYSAENIQSSAAGTYVSCDYSAAPQTDCTLYQITTIPGSSEHWVSGLIPGAWLNVGRSVRGEFTLVPSPWGNHHWVAYAQLLFRLW